ncbi:MAG: hypothetical protein KC503_10400, partial [Myxococcales bacterium]|nr:hypothetical protein [Myxococcales bacterium]
MTNHTCANLRLVDRHFEGRIAPDDERTMREHLPSCSTCRARYARRLFVAGLDPRAEPARDRI